jgi:hypothetical protein
MTSKNQSQPEPINVGQTAAQQAAANSDAVRESAKVNQINEVTPYGNLTYSGDIGSADRTRTTTLNPQDQQRLDLERQISLALTGYANDLTGRAQQATKDPFSLSGVTPLAGADDLSAAGHRAGQAVYDQSLNRINPELDRQRSQLDAQLINRGLRPGSEGYDAEINKFDRGRAQQLNDLSLGSVGAGNAEQSRLFGVSQAARQQGISDLQTERNTPLNELSALLQGSPAIQGTNFAPQAQYQVAAPDVAGLTNANYMGQLNAYNTKQSGQNAMYGALGSIGGAGTGAAARAWWG